MADPIAWLRDQRASKSMLIPWQYPLMVISWSRALLILALTLRFLTPFILNHSWDQDSKVREAELL